MPGAWRTTPLFRQTENTYDEASNLIAVTVRHRYHNATWDRGADLSRWGAAEGESHVHPGLAGSAGRTLAVANYGTNGGSPLSRPDTIPTRSDTVLVTSQVYDPAGNIGAGDGSGGDGDEPDVRCAKPRNQAGDELEIGRHSLIFRLGRAHCDDWSALTCDQWGTLQCKRIG